MKTKANEPQQPVAKIGTVLPDNKGTITAIVRDCVYITKGSKVAARSFSFIEKVLEV